MSFNALASYTTFTGKSFKKTQAGKEIIRESTFQECTFSHCNFSEAQFYACRFLKCRFEECNMKLAKVADTTLAGVTFLHCNLMGIHWSEANWDEWATKLSAIVFDHCVLEYSVFLGLELRQLRMTNCNAREINLAETDLTEADLSGTDFAGAIFLKTNITRANFVGARNYTLNVMDNKCKGARFSLPEAMRLLYTLPVVIVDPTTQAELTEEAISGLAHELPRTSPDPDA
ncbi:MAG: pentapeptide repeat-containing protein [Anaerolineae bacterium]|nr:pentapeptide repeat-containing protein [Anaerolineae bacterium]